LPVLYLVLIFMFSMVTSGVSQNPIEKFPIYYFKLKNEKSYIYNYDIEKLDWKEIRKQRAENKKARVLPQELSIAALKRDKDNIARPVKDCGKLNVQVLTCDPSGKIVFSESFNKEGYISVPEDMNLTGRYILGAQLKFTDNKSKKKTVYCMKYIVSHWKDGGVPGKVSPVFFTDSKKLPLEIGPVVNTGKSKFGRTNQRVHRTYKMALKFMGKPLAGETVQVYSPESGWEKNFITDKNGKFEVTPTDDRFIKKDWQRYFYMSSYNNKKNNTRYVASLPVVVYKNRPEWRSQSMAFIFWSISGTAISVLVIVEMLRRKRRRESLNLAAYGQSGRGGE